MFRHALTISIVILGAGLFQAAGGLKPLADALTELRFATAPRAPTGAVVLVEIDAQSIAKVGEWPWPRHVHADIIRALDRLDPSEIALDIDFSSRSNEADDSALEAALREASGSIVLAAFHQPATSDAQDKSVVASLPLGRFRDHAWLATVNIEPDADGHVRRYPYGATTDGQQLPSIASLYSGVASTSGSFLIDYSIAADRIERISAADLLAGRVDAARVKGRKVIVGASAIELRDIFQVPGYGLISGSLLQALGTETLLQSRALQPAGQPVVLAGLALLAMLVFAARRIAWHHMLLALLSAAASIEIGACILQAWRPILLDTSAWHLAIVGFIMATVGREIDLRRVLLAFSNTDRQNLKTVLDQVIADSFDGIVVVDDEGVIQSVSRTAARILQPERRRNWIGFPAKELVPVEMLLAMRDAISNSAQGEWQTQGLREMRLPKSGAQERVIEYIVTPSQLRGVTASGSEEHASRFIVCLSFRDVTERRLAEQRLEYLAHYDTLTNLPNRNYFMEQLSALLAVKRTEETSGAVLSFDLDRFKTVNDTFGRATGDLLLQAIARRGSELVRPPHVIARMGGDEFAVLWREPVTREDLDTLAQRIAEQIADPCEINGNRLSVGTGIGIALIDGQERDADAVMKRADAALYRAKRAGRGSHCFYEASLEADLRARQRLETQLWEALTRQEFHVVYQPQFELGSRTLVGVEALLRWHHPERGLVAPDEFIPVAEEIGLMETLGEWVLHEACREAVRWPRSIKLSVNVSPVQFACGVFARTVAEALSHTGLPADQLMLEITESLFLQEGETVRAAIDELRAIGVGFALDDFGTGYSSLSYLRKFPLDAIKIDRSFVMGLPKDAEALAIVQAVIALGRSLGMRLVAEGLETPQQIAALQALGCHHGQGYGLGRPQPARAIGEMIEQSAAQQGSRVEGSLSA